MATCIGESEYQLLAPLARQAAQARREPDHRVLIIPGVMGSELGRPRAAPWPDDLLWIDPVDVSAGRLLELALARPFGHSRPGIHSLHLLRAEAAPGCPGFHTGLYSYDWRADIAAAGAVLAAHVRALDTRDVSIVAHSMGGLLVRGPRSGTIGLERVRRVVTLGTPHLGTLAAVQALRATYPTVRRLAALDPRHSAEQLTEQVFHSFHEPL